MNKSLFLFIALFITACATTKESITPQKLVDLSKPEQQELLAQFWMPKVKVEPKYPSKAKRRGESRCLDIVFSIDNEGKTRGYTVRNAVPNDEFVKNAARAIAHWRWQVSKTNPKRVAVITSTQINFIAEPEPRVDIFGKCV
ncbi:energy transducer TonB [Thalassotalea fusca]